MFREPTLGEGELAAYATRAATLDDEAYVKEASDQILAAGYERRYSAADQRVSVLYREAVTRGRMFLYQRGYNNAANRAGIEITANDRQLAKAA